MESSNKTDESSRKSNFKIAKTNSSYNASNQEINEEGTSNLIEVLNDDCLLHIFSYLPLCDRINAEQVCQKWKRISLESWREVKILDVANQFESFHGPTLRQLEEVMVRGGHHITSFDGGWMEAKANDVMEIINKYCKKLTSLTIKVWDIFEPVERCSVFLDVNRIQNLKVLHVGGKFFTEDDLSVVLKNAVNLEDFGVHGYTYTSRTLLMNLSEKCQSLGITQHSHHSKLCTFTNEMLKEVLEKYLKIENLDVSRTQIRPQILLPFSKRFKSLTLGAMINFFKEELSVYESLKLPNLHTLDLFGSTGVTGDILKILFENSPNIEDLNLGRISTLKPEDFKHLIILKKLKYLNVNESQVAKAELIHSAEESGQLEKLSCNGCNRLRDVGLSAIIDVSPKLRFLKIQSSRLTPKMMNATLKSLRNRTNNVPLTISTCLRRGEDISALVKKLNRNEIPLKGSILKIFDYINNKVAIID